MKRRQFIAIPVAVALGASVFAAPSTAGGWAVIWVNHPVTSTTVGTPVEFTYQVLQHGVSKYPSKHSTLVATHAESGKSIDIPVTSPAEGAFSATVTFDQPGHWKLRATAEFLESTISNSFPTMVVTEKGAKADSKPAKQPEATVTVQLINASFTPNKLEIDAGTTVKFVNMDNTLHEIAFRELNIDDSGLIDYQAEFVVTFTEPGEYLYACGPHPGMTGTITVK